ncbi:MAG: bifunctional oligoribonuclease/PAP phosphatase NrnA [Planctomycetota bacterium]
MTGSIDQGAAALSWTSNTDASALAAWLRDRARVLILTHAKPDGDAMGSTLGLARALSALRKREGVPGQAAVCWYAGVMPSWAQEIAGSTPTRHLEADGLPDPASFDALVICDTGSWSQLEPFAEVVREMHDRAALIDHHRQGDPEAAPRRWVDEDSAAACRPVAELCVELLGIEETSALPQDVAEPLLLGMATDTGFFRHSNVTPRTLRTAADLIEAGGRYGRLYTMHEQQDRASRPRLLGRALAGTELHHDNACAIIVLRESDFREVGAGPGETGGFADPLLAVSGVEVAVVLTEVEAKGEDPARVKLSFRSKAGDPPVDVNLVAQEFGGGGHMQAAGARPEGSLEDVTRRVIDALGPALETARAARA